MKPTTSILGMLLLTAAIGSQVRAQSFLTNGLVAYYPFNGNAKDASGNGNNGTSLNTAPAIDRFGNANSALAFNGIDSGGTNTSMVLVSNALINLGQPGYTISMWFMPSNVTQITRTLFGCSNTSVGLELGFDNNNEPGTVDFFVGPGNAFWDSLNNHSPAIGFQAGQWYWVLLTKSNQTYSLYINGQLEDQVNVSAAVGYNFEIEPLIGAYGLDGSQAFTGNINDVRIYDRALSSNEIAELYAYESTPQPASFLTNGLVAYYPFNGNANDASGNGNNGTVYGATLTTDRFGNPTSAYYFNGVNAYIDIPENALLNDLTTNFTLSAWILELEDTTNGGYRIIDKTLAKLSDGWLLDASDCTRAADRIRLQGVADNSCNVLGGTSISIMQWYHVVATVSGTNGSVYLDGRLDGSGDVGNIPVNTLDVFIGYAHVYEGAGAVNWFNGLIDDIRIYNRALSSNEVAELYAYESTPPTTSPPSITDQPQPVTVNAKASVTFTVSAAGTAPLYYQWEFDGTNIAGATSSSLTISNVTQTNLGFYAVVVSNSLGTVTSSNAMLSMYPFLATPFTGLDTFWGFSNTLSVTAWGTGPLTYQWFDNGVAVAGATNQTLTLSDIQFTNAGLYTVVVSSPLGSVTNTPAQIVVNPANVSLGLSPVVYIGGVVGNTYTIQSSPSLTNTNAWTTVAIVTLVEPVQPWVDLSVNTTSPTNTQHFYRVLPGP